MKKIILSLIIILPFTLWSQSVDIKGKILDNDTNIAIPFSTVSLKNKGIGATTGIDGVYNLIIKRYNKNDSLEFRSLGYKNYSVSLQDFLEATKNNTSADIKLTSISFNLNEVVVFPTKEEEVLGILSNSALGAAYNFYPGSQIAVFIPNEGRRKGIIKSISYFFTDKSKKPTAPFKVKILKADRHGNPVGDMLLESVVVSASKRDEWFTVNLEKYDLLIPENGYFVGLELIYTDKKNQYKIKSPPSGLDKKLKFQGPSLGLVKALPPSHTWIGKLGGGWSNYSYISNDEYTSNYMIKSTVKHKE